MNLSIDVQPAQPQPDDRDALDGQLIAWRVLDYTPDAETRFGPRPRVTAEVLICSGEHTGLRLPDFVTFGRLAREMGLSQAHSPTLAARIRKWSRNGRTGYGVDYDLTEQDIATCRAVIAAAAQLPPATPEPPKTSMPF